MSQPVSNRPSTPTRRALIITTPSGEIYYANQTARRWLREFYSRPTKLRRLPGKICSWLRSEAGAMAGTSLIAIHAKTHLSVRRHRPPADDAIALLLELVAIRSADSNRGHGKLTKRENEVLHWIAAGKSNDEIAAILGVSAGTVSKHIHHIFQKLDVENRTAAASFATSE